MAALAVDDDYFVGHLVMLDYLWVPTVQRQRKMLPVELLKLCSRINNRSVLNILFRGLVRVAGLGSLDISVLQRWRKL
jgi:hypothetical protein